MNQRIPLASLHAAFAGLALVGAAGTGLAATQQAGHVHAGAPEPTRLVDVPGAQRVRVTLAPDQSPAEFLAAHGLESRLLSERLGRLLDLALEDEEVARLRDAGWDLEILPEETLDGLANPTEYTYARMVSEVLAFEAAHPSLVKVTPYVGATHEGRTIYELKLSDNVALEEDEPTVFLYGVHHGGEMIGCDILMFWLTDVLANYGTDPVKTAWVDDHEIRVIVIGNPDGWMNNETGLTSGWRKNKRDNNSSGSFETNADGVDLNRNFDFGWLQNGSGFPSSSTYRGPSPGSEPEALLCQNILLANKPVLALSFHMSGEIIYLPWTLNGQHTPDHATYFQFAKSIGDSIPKQNGSGTYPPVVETRYGGFIDDYIYGVTGGLCVTPEVSWSSALVPITTVIANNQNCFPVLFQRTAGPQITGLVSDAVSGAPLLAKIEILEIDTSDLSDRTSDAAFGRYRWLTQPGTYTLRVSKPGYHTFTQSVSVGAGPAQQDVALVPFFAARGAGLAGTGGIVPSLTGSGTPQIGQAVSLDVSDGRGAALALVAIGNAPTSQPLFGGTLLVAQPFNVRSITLGGAPGVAGAGSGSLAGVLPNDPSLQGRSFHSQAVVLDAAAVQGKAMTAGLDTYVE